MGRYSAVKSSSIVVQDMYEFFDFGGMRRAKFGREMFEKVADMEQSVLDLLHNPQKRKDITEKNYKYWLNNYESSVFKNKILRIINGDNNE